MIKFSVPKYIKTVLWMIILNFTILGVRNYMVGDPIFNFLKSNLLSGIVPLIIAFLLYRFDTKINVYIFWIASLCWFLYYPNSPYMISDLIHNELSIINGNQTFTVRDTVVIPAQVPYKVSDLVLKHINGIDTGSTILVCDTLVIPANSPYKFESLLNATMCNGGEIEPYLVCDTLIIFSFAMLSAFCGFISLKLMFGLFKKKRGTAFAYFAILFTLLLSCLGFYMGRLPSGINSGNGNLYSWEMLLHPILVAKIIWKNLFPIQKHISAYCMMFLFGVAQYMLLTMIIDLEDKDENTITTTV